jgi:hypothetical protein
LKIKKPLRAKFGKFGAMKKSRLPAFSSNPSAWLWLFLGAYFVFCLATYRDYGIAIDESAIYGWGTVYLKYFFMPWSVDNLSTMEDATHNYVYPAFLHLFSVSDNYTRFHLINLLIGALLFLAVYKVLFACYRKGPLAVLGCLFVFWTPRLLGELPLNPKDAPFAVSYFLSLAGMFLIPRKVKGWGLQSFWIGTLIGLTTCLRILGLTLLPIFLIHRLWEYGSDPERRKATGFPRWLAGELPPLFLVLFFSQAWMAMLWPYLESDYLKGLSDILRESRFYYWDGPILFMGKYIRPSAHLWYYLPAWFLLTTPLFLLGYFLFSLFLPWFKKMDRTRLSLWTLLSLALGLNLLVYFLIKPIVYNGLRHYLFLLPISSVMAAMGAIEFFSFPFPGAVKKGVLVLTLLNASLVLVEGARLYPDYYAYFNGIAGGFPGAYGKYETEYWATTLKDSAQWLADKSSREPNRPMKVWITESPPQTTYYFNTNMSDTRGPDGADYRIVVNQEADFPMTPQTKAQLVYTVQREGVPLAYVFKLNKEQTP